jgi:hypothetical protein
LFPAISKAQTQPEFAFEKQIQLELPLDEISYTIKFSDLNIEGGNATQDEIFAAIDAGDTAQLRQVLNADSIDIEHIQIDVRLAADGYVTLNQVDFEQVQLNQLVEGRTESAKVATYRESVSSFSGMDDVASDDRNSSFDVEFQNLDLIGFFLEKGMFTNSAEADANLFDQAKVAKFRFRSVDANCEGQNVIMEGPVSPKITDVPGDVTVAFLSHGVEDETYVYSDQFAPTVVDATIAEFITMNFQGLGAEKINCTTSEELGLATVSIGSIILGAAGEGQFNDTLINDLVIDSGPYTDFAFSLEKLRFGALDINPPIERLYDLEDVDWLELATTQPHVFMPEFSGFELVNFESREAGELVGRIGKFAMQLGNYFKAKPTKVRAEISEIEKLGERFGSTGEDTGEMPLIVQSAGAIIDFEWDQVEERLSINELSIVTEPRSSLRIAAQFEGAGELLFADVPEVVLTSILTLKLDQVELNISTDGGLWQAAMALAEEQNSDLSEEAGESDAGPFGEYVEIFEAFVFPGLSKVQTSEIQDQIAAGERDLSVKIAAKNNAVPVPMLQFLVKDIEQLKRHFEVKDVNYDLKN